MIEFIIYALSIAGLSQLFNACLEEGMIFNWYKKLLLKLPKWTSKPLGLCLTCNTVWITIFFYVYKYGFSIDMILFVGLVFVFLQLINFIKI